MSLHFQATTVTIAQGASTSGEIITDSGRTGSLQLPAAFNGGAFTFQGASKAGGNYVPILAAGATSAASLAASQGQGVDLPASVFNYGAIVLTAAATQSALRTIGVFIKS